MCGAETSQITGDTGSFLDTSDDAALKVMVMIRGSNKFPKGNFPVLTSLTFVL